MNVDMQRSIRAAKIHKARIVRQSGVGTDVAPVIEVWRDDELLGVVYVGGRDTAERVAEMRATILAFGATAIVFVMESYFEMAPNIGNGNLAQRFAAGDETVSEAVMVNLLERTGTACGLAVLPYRYVGRKVMWLPPPKFDSLTDIDGERTMGGDVPSGVMPAFAESALLTDRTAALQEFEAMGLEVVEVPGTEPTRVQSTGRNAPCPCGSLLKFKHCCLNTN